MGSGIGVQSHLGIESAMAVGTIGQNILVPCCRREAS